MKKLEKTTKLFDLKKTSLQGIIVLRSALLMCALIVLAMSASACEEIVRTDNLGRNQQDASPCLQSDAGISSTDPDSKCIRVPLFVQ